MTSRPRRWAATLLAVALVMGALPPEAPAQVMRISVGETGGMQISPVQNGAGTAMAPGLSIGAASIAVPQRPSAASIAPAPIVTAAVLAASIGKAAATPIPALSASMLAAAAKPDGSAPDGSITAPIETRAWSRRLAGLFGLKIG